MKAARELATAGRAPGERRGFSLLEIMVTVVVLSVALIPLFDFFGSAPKRAQLTMHRALALTLASQLLERYRALPYSSLKETFGQGEEKSKEALAADPIVRWEAMPPDTRQLVETYHYERDVVFEDVPGEPGLGLLKVYVRWKLGDVPPREITLARVVVDYTRAGQPATP
ncbi:MAG: prepilin-type N-terminal cleavage/methylation domain-containing protein [Candidatus Wallbacteria bacterium]|nr:prepilin-type N-terminal cleavage/methylation domain-containing protein [Candidatus Wallbacteria bacterium]